MERFLFRVLYTWTDAADETQTTYESVCVRAADDDEAAALAEVEDATARYLAAVSGTRTITLVTVTADV